MKDDQPEGIYKTFCVLSSEQMPPDPRIALIRASLQGKQYFQMRTTARHLRQRLLAVWSLCAALAVLLYFQIGENTELAEQLAGRLERETPCAGTN